MEDHSADRENGEVGLARHLLASLIWIVDLILKVVLGQALAALLWVPYWLFGGVGYPRAFLWIGAVLGMCILGFFEGCDIFLCGYAKRIIKDK
jgi:hypothetical protein